MEKLEAYQERFLAMGLRIPEVLLPDDDVSLERFAVIACDQHSAEPAYWEETKRLVGSAPSSLHLMLPEAWLAEKEQLEPRICRTMKAYLENGVLVSLGEGFVYVKRQVGTKPDGRPLYRHGLMACIDLDAYEYQPGRKALIRATEQTVPQRLPERVAIREKAALEMPHVMVLVQDPHNCVSSLLEEAVSGRKLPRLYDFDLMQDGGHILGYRVAGEETVEALCRTFGQLLEEAPDGFLMAVGDGNHSLAAAKICWENHKKALNARGEKAKRDDRLRYALVELVSAYDEGLSIFPIHRLLMHLSPEEKTSVQSEAGFDAAHPEDLQTLQPKLDAYLEKHPSVELEYIHGAGECRELGRREDCLPIVFGEFPRDSIFSTVREHGLFVRKSFSLGRAKEKRYYLETRRL